MEVPSLDPQRQSGQHLVPALYRSVADAHESSKPTHHSANDRMVMLMLIIDACCFSCPQLQGSILVASLLQIVVGFSGLIGFLMRFIGPLTIAPTITLIGLPMYNPAGAKAGTHWGISAMYVTIHLHGECLFDQLERKNLCCVNM